MLTGTKHGTWAGYQEGCREDCCTTAARRYQKGRVLDAQRGRPRTISSVGTRRRIEALGCLGWSGYDIARRLGHGREWLRQVYLRDRVYRSTAERIAQIYDELCMTMPPETTTTQRQMASRTRNMATRKGWVPPLAWDDDTIDDPQAQPHKPRNQDHQHGRDHVDPIVVERVLAGERMPWTTPAEKAEVVRRWTAAGRSLSELERLTGWKSSRYTNQTARRAS